MNKINLIVCVDKYFGFSKNGVIPWHIPEDLKIFRKETTNNVIIMGRTTYESIGKVLPNRVNIILSTNPDYLVKDAFVFNDLMDSINYSKAIFPDKDIFICGGLNVYNKALEMDLVDNIILSYIPVNYECSLFIDLSKFYSYKLSKEPVYYTDFNLYYLTKRKDNKYKFPIDLPELNEEFSYLNLLTNVLYNGELRETRNSPVKSLFSPKKITFDLRNGFPLFTTKRVFWKGIFHELIWFINGHTDSKLLEDKGVHIWAKNSTKEFQMAQGLTDYDEGMIGPMYGFIWRHWGADYTGKRETDYTGCGFDQLEKLINDLKTDPNSRRHLLTTYDPSKVEKSVLCPCHSLPIQFYVAENKYLDCYQYIRSSDQLLGFPFNCASMALLLIIIGNITGYEPRFCSIQTGDTHIYMPHIEAVQTQLKRCPYGFPKLTITKKLDTIKDIETLDFNDIIITNYKSHPIIKSDMIA